MMPPKRYDAQVVLERIAAVATTFAEQAGVGAYAFRERQPGLLGRSLWGSSQRGLPWGRLWIDVDIEQSDGSVKGQKVYAASQIKTAIARHPTGHAFGILALAETMPGVPNVSAYRSFTPRELDELIHALEDMKAEIVNHNGPLIEPAPWEG